MQGRDLKASFVIAAVWLVGITTYSLLGSPLQVNQEGVLIVGAAASGEHALAQQASKHWKLPLLWMHQRWGAD